MIVYVGACKFGFYEYFKHTLANKLEELGCTSESLKLPIWMVASGAAEVVASIALCPMEVTKIHMMMNADEASKGMLYCITNILRTDGITGLYTGLPLIMLRQVPYTCVKLSGYEVFSRVIKRAFSQMECTFPDNFKDISDGTLTTIRQLLGGVLAGVSAAVISQPADVLLSKLCGSASEVTAGTECIVFDGLPRYLYM